MIHGKMRLQFVLLVVAASVALAAHSQAQAPPPAAASFAILTVPPTLPAPAQLTLGYSSRVGHRGTSGAVCASTVTTRPYAVINGSVVGRSAKGVAVTLAYRGVIADGVFTGGGTVLLRAAVRVDRTSGSPPVPIDISGTAPQIALCNSAGAEANARVAELAALPATAGLDVGSVSVGRGQTARIPAVGKLGSGEIVIDASDIQLAPFAMLQLVGDPGTQTVIVRASGALRLGFGARIALAGLTPNQVIFLVDGPIITLPHTRLAGTFFSQETIDLGYGTRANGALLASGDISIAQYGLVNFFPFAGW